jgi:hypothetical protein
MTLTLDDRRLDAALTLLGSVNLLGSEARCAKCNKPPLDGEPFVPSFDGEGPGTGPHPFTLYLHRGECRAAFWDWVNAYTEEITQAEVSAIDAFIKSADTMRAYWFREQWKSGDRKP